MTTDEFEGLEEIMRFTSVILNGKSHLWHASKIALKKANSEGYIPDNKGRMDTLRITGLRYVSERARNAEVITFEQYNALGRPEYIGRAEDGSIIACPEDIGIQMGFPPAKFAE